MSSAQDVLDNKSPEENEPAPVLSYWNDPASGPPTTDSPIDQGQKPNAAEPLLYEQFTNPQPPPELLPDSKRQVKLTQSPARHRRLSYGILVPTLVVFVLTSGLGLAILVWLFTKSKTPASQGFRSGYILVDEGTDKEDGIESATLRALTATSFISTIIAATGPVLMSLVAYRIAHLWVAEQVANRPRHVAGPTPLQYGLMLQVLGASSIFSLYDAVRYLFKGYLRRPSAPSYFTTTVIMGVVVYAIVHLIGFADLWLHATTTAVLYNVTAAPLGSEPLMTSIEFNQTYCTKFNFPPLDDVCMVSYDGWAQLYPWLIKVGQSVASNSSADRMAITLADADNVAIIVPLTVNKLAKFKATTFGMRAHCESLNNKCNHTARQTNCSSIGITTVPSAGSTMMSVVLVPPALRFNSAPLVDNNAIQYGLSVGQVTNPVASVLQLRWSSMTNGAIIAPNAAIDTDPIPAITVYASCSIEVLNATVTYDGTAGGKAWTLVPEETVLSENRFATALIAPFSWQLVTDRLATNIQARAMISGTVEEVMSLLHQELGRLALGFVSGSFMFVPATEVQIVTPTILGRYPLAPLLSFVALLVSYGLIALAIFVMTINATSGSIHIPAQLRDKLEDKTIPELELAQMRLTNPLPVVAQLFAEYKFLTPGASDPDARSAKASAVNLFAEYDTGRATEMRLRIGLESGTERPRYGIWKDE